MAIKWSGNGAESPTNMWIDRNGKAHTITKMANLHLINTCWYIKVYGGKLTEEELLKIDEMKNEMESRGIESTKPTNHADDEITELLEQLTAIEQRLEELGGK